MFYLPMIFSTSLFNTILHTNRVQYTEEIYQDYTSQSEIVTRSFRLATIQITEQNKPTVHELSDSKDQKTYV